MSDDCISRQEVINAFYIQSDDDGWWTGTTQDVEELLKSLQSTQPQPKTGYWIGDAKTYYEELNKRGLGVDEYTPYFTDDIACSECLAKYSMLDNETQFFKHCLNCGCRMIEEQERSDKE